MKSAAIIGALAMGCGAERAVACEPLPPALVKDPAIKVAADCSFRQGQYGFVGPFEGGKVVDIGNGKIGQRLSNFHDSGLCGIENQQLFLMDCMTGADIVFEGAPRNGDAANFGTDVAAIQHPKGPLTISPNMTFEKLAGTARRANIAFETGSIRARAKAIKRINQFDPACGCKLFYPDSVGAKQ
ncbi:MAG: hypothetical protein AB8B51_05565 [Sedimentitalea sp.]